MKEKIAVAIFFIIETLDRRNKWGGKEQGQHTPERYLISGMPILLKQDRRGKKIIEKAKKYLVNQGYLIKRKKTGEWHYWLFKGRENEILDYLKEMETWWNNYNKGNKEEAENILRRIIEKYKIK